MGLDDLKLEESIGLVALLMASFSDDKEFERVRTLLIEKYGYSDFRRLLNATFAIRNRLR